MPEPDYTQVQRTALREMLELSASIVAPAENELEQRLGQIQESARQQLDETTRKIETRFKEELRSAEQEHAEWLKQLEREYVAAKETLTKKSGKSLRQIAAEFEEVEKEALRQKEDNLLMAETVAHATIKGLQKEFKAAKHKIGAMREQLITLRESTRLALEQYKCDADRFPAQDLEDAEPVENPGEAYEQYYQLANQQLEVLRTLPLPRLFGSPRAYLFLLLFCAAAVGTMGILSATDVSWAPAFMISGPVALLVSLLIGVLVALGLRHNPRSQIEAAYEPLRQSLATAEALLDQQLKQAQAQLEREQSKANERRARELKTAQRTAEHLISRADQQRGNSHQQTEQARTQRLNDYEQRRTHALQQAEQEYQQRCRQMHEQHDRDLSQARENFERRSWASRQEYQAGRAKLEQRWKVGLAAIARLLERTAAFQRQPRLDWSGGIPAAWQPPTEFAKLIPYGSWRVDLDSLAPSVLKHASFLNRRSTGLAIPALLRLPDRGSLLLQTQRAGRPEAIETLRAVMLRLLTSLPPGRVHFTIIDPVGLGENFAGLMHLGDYEEALVGGRIWTESEHIEARLTELTSHMENVIQKYLRNEFETIDAYNRQAGELAEPYRFLVIADFPANINEGAARRLNSIVNSGARCGVFTLIAHDQRLPMPPEVQIEDLEGGSVHLAYEEDRFVVQDELLRQYPLTLDTPPDEETLTELMHIIGRGAKDSLRVEVPFETIAPAEDQLWSCTAAADVSVPLGHAGAVRLQHLRLGRGIAQHALIAGKTGSGKSTLLHVMITNLALWYRPDEVEFYLVDFKKGVEFKTYVTHGLPHARAIAIESDREFGVSVLQRIDAELARRGDLFRGAGVQDLAAYRESTGKVLPRTLLIVDEFQVFFTEDDKLSQDAAILLDRLVRQGRAFGIHVLLGSQTLGGTAGLARSTMGQMAVRIALNCSEADSQLILDDTNVAARLLTRPGEAIYNDAGGLVEGNSPFQTAWLSDEGRNLQLERVRKLTVDQQLRLESPIVFEGNAPADIRQNRLLANLLDQSDWPSETSAPQAWLGEAVAIKDPTAVSFKRQSGTNLLIVGQRDAAAPALMASALMCLGVQHAPLAARFIILDGRPEDARREGGLEEVARSLPHDARFVDWRDVPETMAELACEVQRRLEADQADAPAIFLLVHGLQRYRMLRRQEDDFSFSVDAEDKPPAPDKQFAEILREGPPLGVHVLVWSDTLATVERTLDRQSLGEFDYRVLFQMSAADSSNLIDNPDANKLGFYRALLYSEEHGVLEKFRPYAAVDADWLERLRRSFADRSRS